MAITYHFDLYPRDDPRDGTRLVRFTQLQSAEYRGEANGTGAGRISLRGSSVDAAYIDPAGLQYVRVVRDDGSTEAVVGGFFLDNGDYAALTSTGNELLTFGGAGTLSYLARSVMWSHTYISPIFTGQDPFDGIWRLASQSTVYAGGSYLGAMLWRVIYEAQHFTPGSHRHADGITVTDTHDDDRTENALPDLTLGFDQFDDSNGNTWSVASGEFNAQIGENVLGVIKRLMEAGLYVSMDPDTFELNAWENNEHRRDRTGSSWGSSVVRFQAPTGGDIATGNIKSDAKRGIAAFIKRSAILAGGQDVFGASSTGGSDIPWEGFYPSDAEDQAALEGIATVQLAARTDAGDTVRLRMKLGDDPTNGRYLPFEHVQLDDAVTLNTGSGQWDWNEAEFPVAAITILLRQGGDWDALVDLGSTYTSMAERSFQVPAAPTTPSLRLCTTTLSTGETATLYEEWTWDPGNPTVAHPGTASTGPSGGKVWGTGSTTTAVVNPGTGAEASTRWSNFDHDGGSSSVAVTAGTEYRFTGYFNASQYNFAGRIVCRWYNSSDALIQTDQLVYSAAWPRSWTLWSADVVAPTGATQCSLRMFVGAATTIGMSGSIDQVRIYSLSAGSDATGLDDYTGTSNQAARCDHGHNHNDLFNRDAADTHAASSISYDGAFAGSTADNVQDRLDELPSTLSGYVTNIDGGKEVVNTVAAAGSTEDLDLALGNWQDITLTADCTFTLSGATAGTGCSMLVLLRQDGTGGWGVTWPAEVAWPDGVAPTVASDPDAVTPVTLFTDDGGATWFGAYPGASAAPATSGGLPLTAVVNGDPVLLWDENNSLIGAA